MASSVAAVKPRKKRRGGRVPGVPVPSTAKSRAASRVAGWKHGKYAKVVTGMDGARAKLEKTVPGLGEILDAHLERDLEGLDRLSGIAQAQKEILRRQMVAAVRDKGVLVEEQLFDKDGRELGVRVKANPVLEPMRHIDEQLGHTAEQMQTSRKSRGEGAVSEALAFRMNRDAMLRKLDVPRRPLHLPSPRAALPESVEDSEIVEE